jgi:hypothetical protein
VINQNAVAEFVSKNGSKLFPKIIEIELFISERQIFSTVMELRRENKDSIQFVNYPYPGQRKVLLPNVGQFDGFTLGPDIAEICRVLNWAQVKAKATDISFADHIPEDGEDSRFYRRGLRATLFDGNGGITLRTYGEFDIPGVNYDGQRLDAFLLKVVKELGDFEDAGGNY